MSEYLRVREHITMRPPITGNFLFRPKIPYMGEAGSEAQKGLKKLPTPGNFYNSGAPYNTVTLNPHPKSDLKSESNKLTCENPSSSPAGPSITTTGISISVILFVGTCAKTSKRKEKKRKERGKVRANS